MGQSTYIIDNNAKVIRQDYDGFVGGETTLTVVEPIPSNVNVEVHRNGRLLRTPDDYSIAGQVVTLVSALSNVESAVVLWILGATEIYRENWEPTVGTTVFTPTVNNGVLPTDTSFVLAYRNGRLLRETQDYTITGNVLTLVSPTNAGESVIIKIIK